jgi:hypothetical protein
MGWNVDNKFIANAAQEQLKKYNPAPAVLPTKKPEFRLEVVCLLSLIKWLRDTVVGGYVITGIQFSDCETWRSTATYKHKGKGSAERCELPRGIYLKKIPIDD